MYRFRTVTFETSERTYQVPWRLEKNDLFLYFKYSKLLMILIAFIQDICKY